MHCACNLANMPRFKAQPYQSLASHTSLKAHITRITREHKGLQDIMNAIVTDLQTRIEVLLAENAELKAERAIRDREMQDLNAENTRLTMREPETMVAIREVLKAYEHILVEAEMDEKLKKRAQQQDKIFAAEIKNLGYHNWNHLVGPKGIEKMLANREQANKQPDLKSLRESYLYETLATLALLHKQ